jgi:DNA-binding CsgD family transcriptional regulator
MASGGFTRFLERCYDQRAPLDAWIAGLAAAAAPIIAPREGIMAAGGAPPYAPRASYATGRAEWLLPAYERGFAIAPRAFIQQAFRPFRVARLTGHLGVRSLLEHPFTREICGPAGLVDAIGLMARDGPASATLSIPLRAGEARSDREPGLRRVQRHLQSAFMGVVGSAPSADDVVADAGGRLLRSGAGAEWLDGETRELFRAAARAHDADRRGAASDADADRVWRELWRGGWAVVETLDGNGKRLLLLRRDPSNPRAHALDAREQRALHLLARGATYKHVALDLGIGLSTASGVVAKALRKLGFKSRVDFLSHLDLSR